MMKISLKRLLKHLWWGAYLKKVAEVQFTALLKMKDELH